MKMVKSMREIFLIIEQMDLAFINTQMEIDMKVIGKMIFKMVKVLKLGQKVNLLKVHLKTEKN